MAKETEGKIREAHMTRTIRARIHAKERERETFERISSNLKTHPVLSCVFDKLFWIVERGCCRSCRRVQRSSRREKTGTGHWEKKKIHYRSAKYSECSAAMARTYVFPFPPRIERISFSYPSDAIANDRPPRRSTKTKTPHVTRRTLCDTSRVLRWHFGVATSHFHERERRSPFMVAHRRPSFFSLACPDVLPL